MSEVEKIKQRYAERAADSTVQAQDTNQKYSDYIKAERQAIYSNICRDRFKDLSAVELIEIGAGSGDNLLFFNNIGLLWKNIYANELLEDRIEVLKGKLDREATIDSGDARRLDYKAKFDVVFQSTVFTSVLDTSFKIELANKMKEMVKEDGILLWYDFKYDNPNNQDVKGINKREIESLFRGFSSFEYYNVTLLPPLGRRIGNLYNFVNSLFPFLKTHLICVISNPEN